jgi:hypothetical protein
VFKHDSDAAEPAVGALAAVTSSLVSADDGADAPRRTEMHFERGQRRRVLGRLLRGLDALLDQAQRRQEESHALQWWCWRGCRVERHPDQTPVAVHQRPLANRYQSQARVSPRSPWLHVSISERRRRRGSCLRQDPRPTCRPPCAVRRRSYEATHTQCA